MFKIRQKDSDNKKEKESTKKYNFQGNSTRSILWFDLDHECSKESFSTRETDLYIYFLQKTYMRGQETKTCQLFVAPISDAKITKK